MNIFKIYLHWSATSYNFKARGKYHTIVQGDGKIFRAHGYDQPSAHTFLRNSNSVGLAVACMGGDGFDDFPPTDVQIDEMCREAARIALSLGWKTSDITINRVMTHGEAASNRDFPKAVAVKGTGVSTATAQSFGLPHDNYGPLSWPDGWPGGTAERTDLFKLKKADPPASGGDKLREKIRGFMANLGAVPSLDKTLDVEVAGKKLEGKLFTDGRCYIELRKLCEAAGIEIGKVSFGDDLVVNLVDPDRTPRFLADSPVIPGFKVVDIYLNRMIDVEGFPVEDMRTSNQSFMTGILVDNKTMALARDFCEELGIEFKILQGAN